jgi:hypothetical protein
MVDYKIKALKYKLKYLNLKKIIGGNDDNVGNDENIGNDDNVGNNINHDWYAQFERELRVTYNLVKIYTVNLVLGGSAAIAYVLNYLEMYDELDQMIPPPKDFDFMFEDKDIFEIPSVSNGIIEFKRTLDHQVSNGTVYELQNREQKKTAGIRR